MSQEHTNRRINKNSLLIKKIKENAKEKFVDVETYINYTTENKEIDVIVSLVNIINFLKLNCNIDIKSRQTMKNLLNRSGITKDLVHNKWVIKRTTLLQVVEEDSIGFRRYLSNPASISESDTQLDSSDLL
jgi:hypothetical protein